MALTKSEIAAVSLLAVHILVSLAFIFVSKKKCSTKLIPLAWLVSLVVCIIVLSIILMQ
jgi:hypothetical protein